MVRNYVRKTNRGGTPRNLIEDGVNDIIFSGRSIRSVAIEIGMNPMTLCRYVKQAQVMGSRDLNIGYRSPQQVFSTDQERVLQNYIIRSANIYFGLSPKDVRVLAYDCALEFGVKMPDQWSREKCAGPDWFSSFLKRNPSLSIRTPEATSLSRATSFNKANVNRFFTQLKTVIERDCIKPYDIWNVDETGVTTVQKPSSIVGPKGVKQIGALASGERGTLVTMCAAVSATGNTIPPMFVFPRVKFYDHFIRDGPMGCIGTSHPSGWMTSENFLLFIQHFAKIAKPTQERKVLLLLDNHHSHIGLDIIKFARENGIVMLSFPPHCSHKLQPLDRSVFGPFKRYIASLQDTWMRSNPAKTMSIYDLPGISRDAWPRAATHANITNGFKVDINIAITGIYTTFTCRLKVHIGLNKSFF